MVFHIFVLAHISSKSFTSRTSASQFYTALLIFEITTTIVPLYDFEYQIYRQESLKKKKKIQKNSASLNPIWLNSFKSMWFSESHKLISLIFGVKEIFIHSTFWPTVFCQSVLPSFHESKRRIFYKRPKFTLFVICAPNVGRCRRVLSIYTLSHLPYGKRGVQKGYIGGDRICIFSSYYLLEGQQRETATASPSVAAGQSDLNWLRKKGDIERTEREDGKLSGCKFDFGDSGIEVINRSNGGNGCATYLRLVGVLSLGDSHLVLFEFRRVVAIV